MPAEITNLFKAHCKRLAVEMAKITSDNGDDSSMKSPAVDIFPARLKKSEFSQKACDIVSYIRKLQETLVSRKPDYLDFLSPYPSTLTDKDRDGMDSQAEEMVVSCNNLLQLLELNLSSRSYVGEDAQSPDAVKTAPLTSGQFYDHRVAVIALLRSYLKVVCNELSEQKAIRLRYQLDKKKNARIVQNSSRLSQTDKFQTDLYQVEHPQSPTIDAADEQLFAAENQQLYEELVGMHSEVQNVEGQVMEISRLQTVLTDKILNQGELIDEIRLKALSSTENVVVANEEIKTAMKSRAGVRIWLLFFLIVMTLSLLFIDWYND